MWFWSEKEKKLPCEEELSKLKKQIETLEITVDLLNKNMTMHELKLKTIVEQNKSDENDITGMIIDINFIKNEITEIRKDTLYDPLPIDYMEYVQPPLSTWLGNFPDNKTCKKGPITRALAKLN